MISVPEARDRARKRYARHHVSWALTAATGEPADPVPLSLPLHPPTEQVALSNGAAAVAWVASWRHADLPGVGWEVRHWASLGTQEVPVRLVVEEPEVLAVIAGRLPNWRKVAGRVADLLGEWTAQTVDGGEALRRAVRSHAAALAGLAEVDVLRLRAVLRWLVAHPQSGAYIRQLPIRGVDTKWTTDHRGLVTGLHAAITGLPDLGLAAAPGLVRSRFLDACLAPGGLSDVSAPVAELDRLMLRPEVVIVVENLETLVALPALPGAVVVHGAGHAVDRLTRIGWIREARLLYWGDLDSHGFAILDRFRSHCPQVASVLMDRATLTSYRDLWVPEPRPSRAELTRLTAEEAATLAVLRAEGDVRLEQERLDLATSVTRLREVAGSSATGPP